MNEKVILETLSLKEIFERNLAIPDYQRIYCWTEKNVIRLLDDIKDLKDEYRLGTIILQTKNDKVDIIDGQQRLVTLSLLFSKLDKDYDNTLLNQSFDNDEANEYIGYNKYLIENYLSKFNRFFNVENLLNKLTFNVLTLNDSSRELAYTFFSNENSRGCPLNDFDLLKAHHLRYVVSEEQSKHISKKWDSMILNGQDEDNILNRNYERALGLYIFRLRKWLNYNLWDDTEKLKVKNEFEAALIIDQIPPFGEQFQYKEPIQGGAHFFSYVSTFTNKFDNFAKTNQYLLLHNNLTGETHGWFRDVIEALLFAYFLKFGTDYLSDALLLISRSISQVRFDQARIHKESIFECARNSKIVMMIDRATSPTFFLAELNNANKFLRDYIPEEKGIRRRYYKLLVNRIIMQLQDSSIINPKEVFIYE